MLVGNVGTILGGIAAFEDARPDDGRLEVGVVTAEGPRAVGARARPHRARATRRSRRSSHTTSAKRIDVDDGEATPVRARRRRPQADASASKIRVEPAADRRSACPRSGAPHEHRDAGPGDVGADRRRRARDAAPHRPPAAAARRVQRLRVADGFSHARSLAYCVSLVLVQAIIALVGSAAALGKTGTSEMIVRSLHAAVPGPAGELLTSAVRPGASGGCDAPVRRARVRARRFASSPARR